MRMTRTVVLAVLLALPAGARAADEPAPTDTAYVTQAQLKALLEGMAEQTAVTTSDVDKLKKFKFSGYVQARVEAGEASSDTVKVSSASAASPGTYTTANVTRFYIRRARLKLTYDSSPLSQAVVYFDGGTDRTIRLLEAYVTLMDPWTALHVHALTMGQFNVPFGYEIERSSSLRELPERSRAENVLFNGERDRGVKFESQWTEQLKTSFALLNGGGINNADFPTTDPTRGKDFTARARWSQGVFDVAASWYAGHQTTPLSGPDIETDKTRYGLDSQVYFATPHVGGGTLRGEVYTGHDVNPDSLKAIVVPVTSGATNGARVIAPGRDPQHIATDVLGFYVMLVQNFGERLQFAARYDKWDPNTDLDHDQYRRVSLGVNAFYDGFTRLTAAYDAITTDVAAGAGKYNDPKDNLWTIQLQHRF